MKYELREYQLHAVKQVLAAIDSAWMLYERLGSPQALSLAAPTGSGKTVMAAAVIEALLHGAPELGVERDPLASILWVTADPALNRQTRLRLSDASSLLTNTQLVEIDDTFDQERFDPGRVYFLNTQKLAKSTGFVKSGSDYSLWQTIERTSAASDRKLLLIIDEAHQGVQRQTDRATIVQRLIDASAKPQAPPVLWGISATPERFRQAVDKSGRTTVINLSVDRDLVRASGLVKDVVELAARAESGPVESTYLRQAISELASSDALWRKYTEANALPHVHPLAVVQVDDEVTDAHLATLVQGARSAWPELAADAFVHTFGERATRVAGVDIPYMSPDVIQRRTHVRIVFTKLALTSGWDCPRAEVMFSERAARDATFIAQTIGRLARTPLAHRIDDDPRLNRVRAYLPRYDETTVEHVIRELVGEGSAPMTAARVTDDFPLVVGNDIHDVLARTPSMSVPGRPVHPVIRARRLARALVHDELEVAAAADLRQQLHAKLDGLAVEHAQAVAALRDDFLTADILIQSIGAGEVATSVEQTLRTDADIRLAFRESRRRIPDGVVEDYRTHLVEQAEAADDDVDVYEIMADVAALVGLDAVPHEMEQFCDRWVDERLATHDAAIRMHSAEVRQRYQQIKGSGATPVPMPLTLPDVVTAVSVQADGTQVRRWNGHAYADSSGRFPATLNSWEEHVLEVEQSRSAFVCWYRNPGNGAASVTAPRLVDGQWRALHPDFVVISRAADGSLVRAIVDPHRHDLDDALWKLRALADYAEENEGEVVRVESVAKIGDAWRKLDLTSRDVRTLVREWTGAAGGLYEHALASDYR